MKTLVLLLALSVIATELRGAVSADALERAERARADGLPQMAIYDLKRFLRGEAAPEEQVEARALLTRCLLDSGRGPEAVELLKAVKQPEAVERFWLAQALAGSGDAAGALAIFSELGEEKDFSERTAAQFGRAEMLRALGKREEAVAAFRSLEGDGTYGNQARLEEAALCMDLGEAKDAAACLAGLQSMSAAEKRRAEYLDAVLDLEQGRTEEALSQFSAMSGQGGALAAGAAAGGAEALMQLGREGDAADMLENFISANPRSPLLPELMRRLDAIYERSSDPSNSTLKRWENNDEESALAALAAYYFARNDERQGRMDRAKQEYAAFLEEHPNHALGGEALCRLARLLLQDGAVGEAGARLRKFQEAREKAGLPVAAEIWFLRGMADYQGGKFGEAAEAFQKAAERDPALRDRAWFNGALASLENGAALDASGAFAALAAEFPSEAEEIRLENAFRGVDADAGEGRLLELSRNSGDAAVAARASFALAEREWMRGEMAGARSHYRRVANATAAPKDRGEYFEVYLADDGSEAAIPNVVEAAERFVTENTESPHVPEARMKWGEVLSRKGDHLGARVQFELAARKADNPATKSNALFFAAREAALSMDPAIFEQAILLYEEVAQSGGPLAAQARLQQALLQNALGRPGEAVTLLNRLIESDADAQLRIVAQLKKGDTLFGMGATDPEKYTEAIGVWERVVGQPAATAAQRNEALNKAAAAYEKIGNTDAALSAYYRVLSGAEKEAPEYYWYYQAGFDAARLLEAQKRYSEAVAVFEKLATTQGPLASEAKERVKRLRLENFIWEK